MFKLLSMSIFIGLFTTAIPIRADAQQYLCNHSSTAYIFAFGLRSSAIQMASGSWSVQGFYELAVDQCVTLHKHAGRADTSVAIFEKAGWFSKSKTASLRGVTRNGNKLIGWPDPSLYTNAASFCVPKDFSSFKKHVKVRTSCAGGEVKVRPQFGMQSTTFNYSGPHPIVAIGVIQGGNVRVYSPKEYERKYR